MKKGGKVCVLIIPVISNEDVAVLLWIDQKDFFFTARVCSQQWKKPQHTEPAFLLLSPPCSVGAPFTPFKKYCRQGRRVPLLQARRMWSICYSLWTICWFFRVKLPVSIEFKLWIVLQNSLCWLNRTSCLIALPGNTQKSWPAWLILIKLYFILHVL